MEISNERNNLIPDDVENTRVHKIKIKNTNDLRLDAEFKKKIYLKYKNNVLPISVNRKIPFIIEFNMDKQVFEKERYDKLTSNSLNIFNKNETKDLLDKGYGNDGDIHKWKHFRKITCKSCILGIQKSYSNDDFNSKILNNMKKRLMILSTMR
ncbi:hypothetical protein U3516DRAFT_790970 [Neocallimastix sp. 'constans']